jgi:hypothetical protein
MKILQLFAVAALIMLGGCTTVASGLASIAVSTSSATPSQVKTVDEAVKATAVAERGLDTIVNTGVIPKPVLQQLKIAVQAVHNTLAAVETANASGNSAVLAAAMGAFNEALAAYNSYKTLKGIA